MDLVNVTRELLRHRWLLVASVLVAALAAAATQYKLSPLPPSAEARSLEFASAQSQILIDIPRSPVADVGKEFEPLVERAAVYAKLMTSKKVIDLIGRDAGVPGEAIVAGAPVEANQPKANKEPGAEQRGMQLLGEAVPMRLFFASEEGQPIVTISSQAATAEGAVKLADAAVTGFRKYLTEIQDSENVKPRLRIRIEQLGPATGGVVNEGANKAAMVMVFLAVLTLCCLLILFFSSLRRGWGDDAVAADGSGFGPEPGLEPATEIFVPEQWPNANGEEPALTPVGPRARRARRVS